MVFQGFFKGFYGISTAAFREIQDASEMFQKITGSFIRVKNDPKDYKPFQKSFRDVPGSFMWVAGAFHGI